MEQGKSSLNPDAAPYMPTDKQEATELTNTFSELSIEESLKSGDETADRPFSAADGHCGSGSGKSLQADASDPIVFQGIGVHLSDSEFTGQLDENLSDQIEEQYMDEASQIDLDYLAFLFPDISVKFLAKVYSVNGGDLDDSVEMLKVLEGTHDFALPENLPDSSEARDDLGRKVVAEGS